MGDLVAPVVPGFLKKKDEGPALVAAAKVEPEDLQLTNHREVELVFTVTNRSKKLVKLDFPTSQRLEVIVRGPDGKTIFRWSEDRLFEAVAATVIVNPRERIEYRAVIPTRDMVATRTYTIEAVLFQNPEITASVTVTPKA